MVRGPKPGAPRHWSLVLFGLTIPTASVMAAEVPSLVLPIGAVLAVAVSAADGPRQNASPIATRSIRAHHPAPLTFLPRGLNIPDGYSEEFDRPVRAWADPVDRDRIVSFDLFRRPRRGWMASVAYDEESRGPYAGSSQVLGITFEYEF